MKENLTKRRSIVFGTTQERPLVPTSLPKNWTAKCCYTSQNSLGPGSYNVGNVLPKPPKYEKGKLPKPKEDSFISFGRLFESSISSFMSNESGITTSTSGRTSKDDKKELDVSKKEHVTEKKSVLKPIVVEEKVEPMKYPFGCSTEARTKSKGYGPGPGNYEYEIKTGRHVEYQQTLGSNPIIVYEEHDDKGFIKDLPGKHLKKICRKAHYLKLYE